MKDLIERLRFQQHLSAVAAARSQGEPIGESFQEHADLIAEAADRIELLQAALREALPEIAESYRFFRDTQAETRRILNAAAVLGTVRAALGEPKT